MSYIQRAVPCATAAIIGFSFRFTDSLLVKKKLARIVNLVESVVSGLFLVAVFNQKTFQLSDKRKSEFICSTIAFTCISKLALLQFK